ncbi:MAG: pilus assembly protein PilM [Candidatus Paceibacterota bacterium]
MILKNFFEIFPPPRFLTMASVGLDISDDCVRMMELVSKNKGLIVDSYTERKFERSPNLSEVYENPELKKALIDIKKEFKAKFVNVSVNEEHAYIFRTEVPTKDPSEIRSILEFQLEENVPIASSEAVFDFRVLKSGQNIHNTHVLVTVLPKKSVELCTSLLNSVSLIPVSFELRAQAIVNAIIAKGDNEAHMVINIDKQKTSFYIVHDRIVQFTSMIAFGSESFKDISKNNPESTKSSDVVADEIQRLYIYWHKHRTENNYGGEEIQKIIVNGEGLQLNDFCEYVALITRSIVEPSNVWINVGDLNSYVPPIHYEQSFSFASVIGLALKNNN